MPNRAASFVYRSTLLPLADLLPRFVLALLATVATGRALLWLLEHAPRLPPLVHRLGWSLSFLVLGALTAAALHLRDRRRTRKRVSTAHGSARWGDPRSLARPSGFLVGRAGRKSLRADTEAHVLTIAPTGSGKGIGTVIPNLLDYPGSLLCTDIKGENYAVTAAYRRDTLGHTVAVLDPFRLVGAGPPTFNQTGAGTPTFNQTGAGTPTFNQTGAGTPTSNQLGAGTPTFNQRGTGPLASDRMGAGAPAADPAGRIDAFNPLDLIDPASEEAPDVARLLASMLVVPETGRSEPFWEDEAASLIAGLLLYVAVASPPGSRHLGTVRHLLTLAEEDFAALLAAMSLTPECGGLIQRAANRIRQKDPKLLSGILASTNRHTEFLDSPQILRTLTASTFRLEDLKHWRLSLYLVLPPQYLQTHGRWLRLLTAATLRVLTTTPVRPADPVLLLLDEFAALGRMPIVEDALSYARGYGISIWMLVQDLAQLRHLYRDSWETLLANTRIKQAFGIADDSTADYLSRLTGQTTVRTESLNRSRGSSSGAGWFGHSQSGTAYSSGETGRRLLFPDEIRRLPRDAQLLFLRGADPLLVQRLDYRADRRLARRAQPNPMHA
ncbi:MAG: type IV secretory system conjugative DNA transfer family protein [Acidobacteriota bacterium]|nr:type IV secretory system conjugative DNA transfer family protein [Acidobacteriota bacterium]